MIELLRDQEPTFWEVPKQGLPDYFEAWRREPCYRLFALYCGVGEATLDRYVFAGPDSPLRGPKDVMREYGVPNVASYDSYEHFQVAHPELGLPDAIHEDAERAMAA